MRSSANFYGEQDDHAEAMQDDFYDDPMWREPDADAVYDMGHDCRENEVERSSQPTRSGRFKVWGECALCGRLTTPPYTDSIL
jgi:hypothetical protein